MPPLWLAGRTSWFEGRPSAPRQFDGTSRMYLSPDHGGTLLNLGKRNVFGIPEPKTGDLALHDGSGFDDGKPRLAVFGGKDWLFFGSEVKSAQKAPGDILRR